MRRLMRLSVHLLQDVLALHQPLLEILRATASTARRVRVRDGRGGLEIMTSRASEGCCNVFRMCSACVPT